MQRVKTLRVGVQCGQVGLGIICQRVGIKTQSVGTLGERIERGIKTRGISECGLDAVQQIDQVGLVRFTAQTCVGQSHLGAQILNVGQSFSLSAQIVVFTRIRVQLADLVSDAGQFLNACRTFVGVRARHVQAFFRIDCCFPGLRVVAEKLLVLIVACLIESGALDGCLT